MLLSGLGTSGHRDIGDMRDAIVRIASVSRLSWLVSVASAYQYDAFLCPNAHFQIIEDAGHLPRMLRSSSRLPD
jgi:hypothetical protein